MTNREQLTVEQIEERQEALTKEISQILVDVFPLECQVRKLHNRRCELKKQHLRLERQKFQAAGRKVTKLGVPKAVKKSLVKKPKLSLKDLAKLLSTEELLKLLKGDKDEQQAN